MSSVNQITEIIRLAVTTGDGIITGGLITPRTVEGVFAHRHKLNVRIVHIPHIVYELIGQLTIGEILAFRVSAPRSGVNLVGEHGATVRRFAFFLSYPRIIIPLVVVEIIEPRCRFRLLLGVKPVGIGLHDVRPAPLWFNGIFVIIALF